MPLSSARLSPRGASLLPLLCLSACVQSTPGQPSDTGPVVFPTSTEPPTPTESLPDEPERLCNVAVECFGNILDEPKVPCVATFTDADGLTVYDGPAGFEKRGRSSQHYPKPQYAVELREHTELPVWPGATWRYLDDGVDAGEAWREPAFDDSQWPEGPAPIGSETNWLQTTVSPNPGPDGRSVTTYLRKTFTVGKVGEVTHLDLGLKRTDGAAIWLNGVEIVRDDLPPGATYDTPALSGTDEAEALAWHLSEVDRALLLEGPNLLAAEVHRTAPESPAIKFDLYLEAKGDDASVNLFGMGGEEDWILNGQYVDRSFYRNRLAYDVFQATGGEDRYATESVFCELTLNGEYEGIYTLGEKIERDDDRLDLQDAGASGETFIVKLDDEDGFHPNAVGVGTWQLEYPNDPDAEPVVSAWLSAWEQAVLGPNAADPEVGVFGYLDLHSAVDWVLLQELTKNQDAYQLSVYLWKDGDGKMFFAPWDFDLSMGYPYTDCSAEGWASRTSLSSDGVKVPIDFIDVISAVPAFRDALVVRWAELRRTVLSEASLMARIDRYEATLAPALAANAERWPIEEVKFSTTWPEEVDNWLCPVESYEADQVRTRTFLIDRLTWMDEHVAEF